MQMTWLQRLQHRLTGWKNFTYPSTPTLPPKPWHPDGDAAVRAMPQFKLPNSDEMIAHLKANGGLHLGTGSTKPNAEGMVNGYPLNAGYATDSLLTITKELPSAGKLYALRSSQYGQKFRYGKRMIVQGEPMVGYSDSKLHVFDLSTPGAESIIEVQNFRASGSGYACDSVGKYQLSSLSTMVTGRSAAKLSLAMHTLRYDDLILNGWRQRASMGVRAARHTYIYPAMASDGPVGRVGAGLFDSMPDNPDAPPMGVVLKLKKSALDRLEAQGYTAKTNPQAFAVLECYYAYGVMIVDTGGFNSTHVEPDNRWDQVDMKILTKLTMDDFEAWTILDEASYRDVYL